MLLFLLFIITGCSTNDDLNDAENSFYKNALINANSNILTGTWAIFDVAYDNRRAEVPIVFEECGRDFFQFAMNGFYRDYVIISSDGCEKQTQELEWELNKGIIRLHSMGQQEELVILELAAEKLVFKMRVDIDDDGEKEIITFGARRYSPPNDPDLYTYTFGADNSHNEADKIKLTWLSYSGFYNFSKYEIYRSTNGCSKTNAQLIAKIEDRTTNFFIDKNPPVQEEICYFFKIYNEKGLLGESGTITFNTKNLRPAEVEFIDAKSVNNGIELKWQPFTGNYFSHYEIRVRNYLNSTGYAHQEYPIKIITDKNVTTFFDSDPPRLKNPVYSIYIYDIFGNISSFTGNKKNAWELNWKHPEVLDLDYIQFVSEHKNGPEILIYGRKNQQEFTLLKYNYHNKQITATANKLPGVYTSVPMRLYNSENGSELYFPQGNALAVYDAANLVYKYDLVPGNLSSFDDFVYLGNNIFSFTNRKTIFTYKRTNANMELISQKNHFSTHFSSNNYHLIPIKNGEILVGHYEEPQSFKFYISANGEISPGELVNIPLRSNWEKKTLYSPNRDYVINLHENKLYSTRSFNLEDSFESPYFSSGISRNGNLVLGSNNNPRESITNESIHEKKARFFNLSERKLTSIDTKGYPHLIFENYEGKIISISTGFKRESLDKTAPKSDIFVEVIQ